MGKMGNWALDGAMEHFGANGQIREPSDGENGAPDDLMGEIGGPIDHEFFSNGLIRLHCALSNLWAPNFN